jgi:arylsulfatase A-like enzyme
MAHVMLVVVDALRADHVGCYAGKDLGTPNLDRLAREGVRFSNAVSQAASTRPSVASLMTGLYPSQHGLADNWQMTKGTLSVAAIAPSVPTLAEILSAQGHTTAFVGGNANLKPLFGLTRGFTHALWRPSNDGAAVASTFEQWLKAERPAKAFCYLHFMDVHNPLPKQIPSRLDRGLDLDQLQESMRELLASYAAAVSRVDEYVAEVVRALEAAGMADDTLVIVTADHGEELGEHGTILAHGRSLYRELVHVPLVMRFPDGFRAGSVIDEAVQLIDLMPTIIDYLGPRAAEVAGRSLLPLLRGEAEGAPAFSQLFRREAYTQSVTTRTHQFIERYLLQAGSDGSTADLLTGMPARIKGEPIEPGSLLATKVSLKEKAQPKVRGTVERVDVPGRSLTVMGVTFGVDDSTLFIGGKNHLSLDALAEGDKVTALLQAKDRRLVAKKIKRTYHLAPKSKIEGTVERCEELEGGALRIGVLGVDVLISPEVKVRPPRRRGSGKATKDETLTRVLTGDVLGKEPELYAVVSDPAETRNLVDERPEIVQELEATLAAWIESLPPQGSASRESVDIDPETLEQLRRMGYMD